MTSIGSGLPIGGQMSPAAPKASNPQEMQPTGSGPSTYLGQSGSNHYVQTAKGLMPIENYTPEQRQQYGLPPANGNGNATQPVQPPATLPQPPSDIGTIKFPPHVQRAIDAAREPDPFTQRPPSQVTPPSQQETKPTPLKESVDRSRDAGRRIGDDFRSNVKDLQRVLDGFRFRLR